MRAQNIRAIQARRGRDDKDDKKLREACQEFEAIFLEYILKEMRATVPKDGLFGGGRPEEFFTSLLDEKLAEEMAKGRGMGLGEVLYRQFSSADKHPR
ncbi:MAG: flagellar biosynthesis protein FlgJ [Firmicutes bacterium]|nr:flagellar biosynthesis protein FlgJ [Bacillota bacterium]